MSKRLRRETRENGTVFVRSYHDFRGTDSIEALKALTEKCFAIGADIAKIVTTADSQDNASVARVLSLYDSFDPAKLIAFAMGEQGQCSRIQCLAKGAPYTYAALDDSEVAAPGQMTTEEMMRQVYAKHAAKHTAKHAAGCADDHAAESDGMEIIPMPSSKSFAQRAIIAAALADGTTTLKGYSPCGGVFEDFAVLICQSHSDFRSK